MRYIYITENNIRQMVVESVRQLITESKQTRKAKSDMTGIAKELKGLDQEQAKPVIDKFLQDVFHTITLDNKYTSKYAPPLFRLYLTGEMGSDDKGHDVIAYLLDKCTENEGFVLDPKELNVSAFNKILKDIENAGQSSFDRANKVKRTGNSDYEIRRDLTFKQANEIGNYSYPGLPLCYTQSVGTWNSPRYSNNDRNICYVLLKKGWKELKPVHDNGSTGSDGDPYDTYGMSMIFFFVGPDGRLVCSNTRWNHNADWGSKDCDQAFTEEMISNLVGAPFSEEFPFFDKWAKKVKEHEKQLANGEDPKNIFDYVGEESNGFRNITLNGLENFLTKDNKILCKVWFKEANNFQDGFAVVQRGDNLWNFIKPDGTYLSDEWFKEANNFQDGFGVVRRGEYLWNFIKPDGTFLTDMWFDSVRPFQNGFASVRRGDDLWNFLKPDGTFLTDMWFHGILPFKNGLAIVQRLDNWLWNFIKSDGTFLTDMWFQTADNFENGLARVLLPNGKYNYLKSDGTLLIGETEYSIKDIRSFKKGFAIVKRDDNKYNYVNEDGKFLSENWFTFVYEFSDCGYGVVENEEHKQNYISREGRLSSLDGWFGIIIPLTSDGWALAGEGSKINFIKPDGRLYSQDRWLESNGQDKDDIAKITAKISEIMKQEQGQKG